MAKKKSVSKGAPLNDLPNHSDGAHPAHSGWTFMTNHLHVLLCLYRKSDMRLRDVAFHVGITERMVQRIIAELVEKGYLHVVKEGRRNRYLIDSGLRLRHPLEIQHTIGALLAFLN